MAIKKFFIFSGLMWIAGCIQPQPTEQESKVVQNPIIRSVTANPTVVQVGQSSAITCDAYDPQGDLLNYKWKTLLGDIVG